MTPVTVGPYAFLTLFTSFCCLYVLRGGGLAAGRCSGTLFVVHANEFDSLRCFHAEYRTEQKFHVRRHRKRPRRLGRRSGPYQRVLILLCALILENQTTSRKRKQMQFLEGMRHARRLS